MTQLQLPIALPSDVQLIAARKLQRIVTRTRNSYRIIDYRKRRAATLRGLGR
jgi:hypothetical protein